MTVLIVDDSKAMRMIITRTLRQAGYDGAVIEAADGSRAYDILRGDRPDLVLCDWNMPVMSGIELLEKLGAERISVPFGFVTSESTALMRAKAQAAGALFLISKPFTPESFEDVLHNLQQ